MLYRRRSARAGHHTSPSPGRTAGGLPAAPAPTVGGKGRALRSATDGAGRRPGRRGGKARPRSWAVRLTSAPGLRSQSRQDSSQLRSGDPHTLQPLRHLHSCCYSCSDFATAARSQETTTDGQEARAHPLPPFAPPLFSSPPQTTVAVLGGKALNARSREAVPERESGALVAGAARAQKCSREKVLRRRWRQGYREVR